MSKISRRRFLQLGMAGAATLVFENRLVEYIKANELTEGGASVSRTTNLARVGIPSTCYQCEARCGIIGFVEEGKLVKIEGNPKDQNNRGRICAKGQAGINYIYNPDRTLYPLKRVGQRGQGKWKRITWDEAYAEVADRLQEIRDDGKPDEVVFFAGIDGRDGIVGRFLRSFGTSSVILEQAAHSANKWIGQEMSWGASYDIADAANSKYILSFGANPYETHAHFVPLIQRIIDGRMNGAKLITFDCRLSHTAGKSDRWFPIRPGTDAIVALAMANVIMQRRLFDKDFVENWLNYRTDLLEKHLSQYTPEKAEEASGISASDIAKVALEFAMTKPAVAISAGGVSSHTNGVYNERAVALLNALTGNVDVRGGSCLPRNYDLGEPDPQPPAPTTKSKLAQPGGFPLAAYSVPQKVIPMIKEGHQKVRALITCQANPVFNYPESEAAISILKDEKLIPFFVAIDSYITETAALADIVLPAATYLESWDIESPPSYLLVPFVSLRQPVVSPVGESEPIHDILIELARRIGSGMEKHFAFDTMEQYIEAAIGRIEGLTKAGGLKYLKANGVFIDPASPVIYKSYERGGFNTPSRRYEVYSKRMEGNGFNPLPAYVEPPVLIKQAKNEEFTLVMFKTSVHNSSTTATSIWLNEIMHENPLWINMEVAREKGIKKGDKVKVTSPGGTIIADAQPSFGIHPTIVAIGDQCGHWEYGRIAKGQRFESEDPNTKLIWWAEHGNGVHVQRIIPIAPDPIGGGQAWTDIKVTISKV
ncbi:MAG: molybdopterin-dependent oxidoreductase [Dehalococcoidales bacterium]|nr:molybdopterin-dependent oxidoreductase [Dehalococcoidales bacterium]